MKRWKIWIPKSSAHARRTSLVAGLIMSKPSCFHAVWRLPVQRSTTPRLSRTFWYVHVFAKPFSKYLNIYYNFSGVYQEGHVHPRCTEARPHHLRQLLPRKTASTGRPLVCGYRDVCRPLAPRKQAQEDTRILQGKLQPKGLSGAPDGGWRMVLQHFDCRTTQCLVRRLSLNLQRDGPGKV